MRRIMAAALVLGATMLGATGAGAEEPLREITGSLTYLQRIAIPAGAQVTVEARGLRDVLLDRAALRPEGVQVPYPFALQVPEVARVWLTATIVADGGPAFTAGPIEIAAGVTAAGEIVMRPGRPAVRLVCGDMGVTLRDLGGDLEVTTSEGDVLLRPVPAASGARYEAEGDPATWFWSKGDDGTLSIGGEEWPDCVPAPDIYTAQGNEPFWSFGATGDEAVIVSPAGVEAVVRLLPPIWRDGAVEWETDDGAIRVRMEDRICRDTMTGMPFPETVTLYTEGTERRGCGGDPGTLLFDVEWVVEDIGGAGLIDGSRVTMAFREDGGIAGKGGCNQYGARMVATGEGITITPGAATMMACAEAIMRQEQAFFAALTAVVRFDIDETGALLLVGPDETAVVTARR
jgi:heat shock protein HslJ/uncharacterized lipoprotein YbaY/uncharacterized membrane protein